MNSSIEARRPAPRGAMDSCAQVRNVEKSHDGRSPVVERLDVAEGGFLAPRGPSGSSKTTKPMMRAGFEWATAGLSHLHGKDRHVQRWDRSAAGRSGENLHSSRHTLCGAGAIFTFVTSCNEVAVARTWPARSKDRYSDRCAVVFVGRSARLAPPSRRFLILLAAALMAVPNSLSARSERSKNTR